MLILRLWNYIKGYVIIMVEGYFPEKFINVCISRGVYLWDINRQKSCTITLKVGIKAFKRLRPIIRKTRCRVKICAKRGLPFIFYRHRKRKTFLAGAFLFIGMVYFLSSFVWTVEVKGNKRIEAQEIVNNLAGVGLKVGTWKPMVDTDRLTNQMMITMKDIAWISIDISGTRAIVEVSERVKTPIVIDKNVPCNIVAAKDGVISAVIVFEGTPLVKAGDTVKRGDLLVAGMVESKDKAIRYVHSIAKVEARTWYEETIDISLSRTFMKRTGKYCSKYSIIIFGKTLRLWNGKIPYENSDAEQIVKYLSIGRDNILPFGLTIDSYYEKKPFKENIDVEQAKDEAVDKITRKLEDGLPEGAKIQDRKIYHNAGNGEVKVRMLIECLEDIGVQERITY